LRTRSYSTRAGCWNRSRRGVRWAHLFLKFRPAWKRVSEDKSARAYTDLALSPSTDAEQDEMDLIQVFKGAIPRSHGAPGFVGKPDLRPALS
jgi:hypothetical protein